MRKPAYQTLNTHRYVLLVFPVMAGSVHQRLINKARKLKEDFNFVLIRYALERLLYRLSQSPYRNHFILKGAMLFQIWSGQFHRSTRDLDLLGKGTLSPQNFKNIFLLASIGLLNTSRLQRQSQKGSHLFCPS